MRQPSRAPGSALHARAEPIAKGRPGQKNTGLSRSELRPVKADQGCAMERAVREGDTGLHHTAKIRRCLLNRGQRAGPGQPDGQSSGRFEPNSQRAFRCQRWPRPPLRFASSLDQASRGSSRARSEIMPGLHGISTPAPPVFRHARADGAKPWRTRVVDAPMPSPPPRQRRWIAGVARREVLNTPWKVACRSGGSAARAAARGAPFSPSARSVPQRRERTRRASRCARSTRARAQPAPKVCWNQVSTR